MKIKIIINTNNINFFSNDNKIFNQTIKNINLKKN